MPLAKAGKMTSSKPPPKKRATKPPPKKRVTKPPPPRRTGKRGSAKGAAVKVKVEPGIEEAVNVKTAISAVKIKTEKPNEEDSPPQKRALTLRSSRKENTSIAINSKKIRVEKGNKAMVLDLSQEDMCTWTGSVL